jgi:DNA helicase-2/ATP-dependent DNA helicase PcrA
VTDQPSPLVSNRADGPLVERLVADDEGDEAKKVAQFILRSDPNLVRTGEIAVLARTNKQLGLFEDALRTLGLPVRRSATASGSPLQVAVRQAAALGSASQLRAWAHDVLDAPVVLIDPTPAETRQYEHQTRDTRRAASRSDNPPDPDADPERRVAAGVLEFLRDQTLGDGAGFRSWVATTNPFQDASTDGVELLTFHASKGREWHTVIVSGVESSLVPHKSATTAATKAEEGRLLYVATTRATDRLLLTHAARRGGYARTVSPYIAELELDEASPSPPPPRQRRASSNSLLSSLRTWRDEAARAAGILPTQLCSDRDLSNIAHSRPTTADELAELSAFGQVTARRLAPQILPLIEAAEPVEASSQRGDQSDRSTMTGA